MSSYLHKLWAHPPSDLGGQIYLAEIVAALVQVDFLPDVFPGAKGHSGFLEVNLAL